MFPIERWAACPPQGAGRSSIKARQKSEELSDMGTYKCFIMRGFRKSEGNLGFWVGTTHECADEGLEKTNTRRGTHMSWAII
jgi:hypothetical protein